MTPTRNLIVLITPGFAAAENDCSCLPLQQALVRAWSRLASDCAVAVLALHYPYHHERYRLFGADVYPFNGKNRGGLQRWRRSRSVWQCLEELREQYRILGLVSCWYGEAAALASRFARRQGLPHFCWLLGQDARAGNPWPQRLRLPAGELVALSESVQRGFARSYGVRPAHLITPGIELLTPPAAERTTDILGVGSLISLKRWPVFLQVVAGLSRERPGLRAMIVGEGPEEARLRALAAELGLAGIVHFAGPRPHREVLQLMAQARVLLHPSEYEGYSGVCQEALSVGTPVVSVCNPGGMDPRYWQQGSSVEELRELLLPWLAMNGIPSQHFPIEDTARKWIDLLQEASSDQELSRMRNSSRAMAVKEKYC